MSAWTRLLRFLDRVERAAETTETSVLAERVFVLECEVAALRRPDPADTGEPLKH